MSVGTGRRRGRLAVTLLIWLLIVPGLFWAAIRLGGWERGWLIALLAYTPFVAAWSVLPAILALATRRWTAAAVAVAVVLSFAVFVLPRAFPGGRGPAAGSPLTVMTSNMLFGGADPEAIVRLVKDNDVEVLALQEFTPEGRDALDRAGLGALLPYSSLDPVEDSPAGSAVYSRYPIGEAGVRLNEGGFRQAYGMIHPPGATPLLVESAHPLAPSRPENNGLWRRDLAAQPVPDPDGPPRILLGDFNSTLDHAPLRRLIARGYRDAAAATGQGLTPTWPFYEHPGIPPATIDHVLVDKRLGVRAISAHTVPHTDHRAVVCRLTIPAVP
ncbi:endonuclease/exonuclease/phosphatase family protein [Actinoplanes sp. CA-030573]|uniref:endonuclease/exonuclease/phosphatase family protein n=1 Tax=Actinoplanes sp. CA-030573 TaxID=3239898 RepID=UPI003D8F2F6A